MRTSSRPSIPRLNGTVATGQRPLRPHPSVTTDRGTLGARSLKPTQFAAAFLLALGCSDSQASGQERPGYRDTPTLPNSTWRVHDADRPYPNVVTPPASNPFAKPPEGAVVLLSGNDPSGFRGREGQGIPWTIEDDCIAIAPGTGDLTTVGEFGDCHLHLEWAAPVPTQSDSQNRGNSGVFFMNRYEIQILDSFENPTYADGQAAALYGQKPPRVNACRPPGVWQSFDVLFTAPRFDSDGKVTEPARVTLFHNGVLVHAHEALLGATAHRSVAKYAAHQSTGPIRLQDHGSPVRFRNLWILPLPGDQTELAKETKGDSPDKDQQAKGKDG